MAKTAYAIVGVIAIVAVVGAYLVLTLPAAAFERTISFVDYGYDAPGSGPTLRVKAGQTIRLTFTNLGAVEHEFMLVSDKDAAFAVLKDVVDEIVTQGLSDDEAVELYEARHHDLSSTIALNGIVLELESGESDEIEFTLDEPGTYWFVCHNAGGTWPDIHQDRGMFGKIIVES